MDFQRSVEAARQTKAALVRAEGVGTLLGPLVELWRDGEQLGLVDLTGSSPRDDLLETAIVAHRADGAVFVDELFFADVEATDMPVERLPDAFAGGDAAVREAVALVMVGWRDRAAMLLPFRYAGRAVMWDEPVDACDTFFSDELGVPVPRILTALAAVAAGAGIEEAAHRFDEEGMVLQTARAAHAAMRNALCPCGSGERFWRCCGW